PYQTQSWLISNAEQCNHANIILKKSKEYHETAASNLIDASYTAAAEDVIHTGISAKVAIITVLTGATCKRKDHEVSDKELRQALGKRPQAVAAERALRESVASKGDVEYGAAVVTAVKAESLVQQCLGLGRPAHAKVCSCIQVDDLAPITPDAFEVQGRLETASALQTDHSRRRGPGEAQDLLGQPFCLFPLRPVRIGSATPVLNAATSRR